MGLIGFIKNIFKSADMVDITKIRTGSDDQEQLAVEAYAVFSAVEFAANLISNCEYKTFRNGKPVKGAEWYSLNVRPNRNQSATEFWREFLCKLLYEEEALIVSVGTERIIADTFHREDYAIKEQAFSGVTRGDFTFSKSFTMSEVFYVRYPNQKARALKESLLSKYAEISGAAAAGYLEKSGAKGIVEVSAAAQGDPKFEERFKELMNNRFRTYFKSRNAVLPLFSGMKYTPQSGSATTEIADIAKIFDDALMRAAQAYMISPALIRGEVAGIKDALDLTLTVCADPIANLISEEITGKEFSADEVAQGNFVKADTSNIKHIDIFDIAANVDKLIASGFSSIDEARESAGLEPTGEEWAKKHYITKNYENVDILKGGE